MYDCTQCYCSERDQDMLANYALCKLVLSLAIPMGIATRAKTHYYLFLCYMAIPTSLVIFRNFSIHQSI